MGKIVVFTTPLDIHSQRIRKALQKRELPFVEISVDGKPDRWRDVCEIVAGDAKERKGQTPSPTIPAVFVSSTFVGGAKPTLRMLREWDKDERYACALEKYEMEIDRHNGKSFCDNSGDHTATQLRRLLSESQSEAKPGIRRQEHWNVGPDPARDDDTNDDDTGNEDPVASEGEPTNSTLASSAVDSSSSLSSQRSLARRTECLCGASLAPPLNIPLPDGTMTTFFAVTETLRSVLSLSDVVHKGTQYRKCFSGSVLLEAVGVTMRLSLDKTVEFCHQLIQHHGVIVPVSSSSNLCSKSLYRLQCYTTPEVLNSYKIMQSESDDGRSIFLESLSPLEVADVLDACLSNLELKSLNSRGKVDYSELVLSDGYPEFEESVCSLQLVDMAPLNEDGRLAFSLNVYRLMMRYAFTKVGYFTSEEDRLHFMKSVKFNVGGMTFSFQQWVDGILRANRRSSLLGSLRGGGAGLDKRMRRMSLAKMDWRVHFAANCHPMFGSRLSLPFRTFTAAGIDQELETVTRLFLQDPSVVFVDEEKRVMKLTRIFQWYRHDYAPNHRSLIARISDYVPHPAILEKVTKVKYVDVPWTANSISYARYQKDVVVGQVTAVGYMLMGRFKPPPTPCNEKLRVATLRSLNLLDTTTSDERINRITNACQADLQAPIACVTLVDTSRQWFKSAAWECSLPPVPETPKDISFCGHAVAGSPDDVLIVEDAAADDRFADNPFVAGDFGARFYVGVPLSFPSGGGILVNVGTLCVIDFKPRLLSDHELNRLRHYASLVKQEILRLDDGSTDLRSRCSSSSLDSEDGSEEDVTGNGFESVEECYAAPRD